LILDSDSEKVQNRNSDSRAQFTNIWIFLSHQSLKSALLSLAHLKSLIDSTKCLYVDPHLRVFRLSFYSIFLFGSIRFVVSLFSTNLGHYWVFFVQELICGYRGEIQDCRLPWKREQKCDAACSEVWWVFLVFQEH